VKRFPLSLLDELGVVFRSAPSVVYQSPQDDFDPFPSQLPLKSVRFTPGSNHSEIEVVLDDGTQSALTILISASDYKESYDVPNTSNLSSLAWVISIRAMENVFSIPRSKREDVVVLK
jgi:hypothetical protein